TLERVELADRSGSPVKALSKGMQQRLGFAQAIINEPKLLLLDEPFSGLDPLGRRHFRELILELNRAGTTVVLSSHILSDVEHICNRVSIMAKGEIKTIFSMGDTAKLFGEHFELSLRTNSAPHDLLANLRAQAASERDESSVTEDLHTFTF